ncbi:MAG: DUF1254 domain-containing protein [Verrucomicrobia bacterium]|nr:DUF1254 domain-containing protein [Verrucomicrobiota bacterium]
MAATATAQQKTKLQAKLTPAEARSISKEVFLWGMHSVAIYYQRYNFAQNEKSPRYVGINRLSWDRKPQKALPRLVTTPNATVLYGFALLDLSKEPVVITVPEIKDHYWSIQLVNNYARWWHLIGNQFNAPGPVRRLLIGPNWSGKLPEGFVGADIVQSPSDFAAVAARLALTDDTDDELKVVNAIQDHISVMSLGQWIAAGRKDVKAEDVPLTKGDYPTYPGMETVREPGGLKGVEFLRWVSLVLNDTSFTKQTDGNKEIEAFARFQRLGLKAGETFDPEKLTPAINAAVEEGIEDGRKEVMALLAKGVGVHQHGWEFMTDLGYKDTDWQQRALWGLIAMFGPVPSRSEFWEIPLYDREGYFYDNPINRYTLNSYMLKRGKLHTEGGKLVIYVQHDEPTDPKQRQNWLPAPKGGFQFAARFYGPYTPLIDGSYNMPGVVRVE